MKRILSLACAATFAVALSIAATAAAPVPSPTGEYCAVRIEPLGADARPAAPVCFDTQSEVDAYLARREEKWQATYAAYLAQEPPEVVKRIRAIKAARAGNPAEAS